MPFSQTFQKILDSVPLEVGVSTTSRHLGALKLYLISIISDDSVQDFSSTVASADTPQSLSTVAYALGGNEQVLSSLSPDISLIFDGSSKNNNFFREIRSVLFELILNPPPGKEAGTLEMALLCIKALFRLSIRNEIEFSLFDATAEKYRTTILVPVCTRFRDTLLECSKETRRWPTVDFTLFCLLSDICNIDHSDSFSLTEKDIGDINRHICNHRTKFKKIIDGNFFKKLKGTFKTLDNRDEQKTGQSQPAATTLDETKKISTHNAETVFLAILENYKNKTGSYSVPSTHEILTLLEMYNDALVFIFNDTRRADTQDMIVDSRIINIVCSIKTFMSLVTEMPVFQEFFDNVLTSLLESPNQESIFIATQLISLLDLFELVFASTDEENAFQSTVTRIKNIVYAQNPADAIEREASVAPLRELDFALSESGNPGENPEPVARGLFSKNDSTLPQAASLEKPGDDLVQSSAKDASSSPAVASPSPQNKRGSSAVRHASFAHSPQARAAVDEIIKSPGEKSQAVDLQAEIAIRISEIVREGNAGTQYAGLKQYFSDGQTPPKIILMYLYELSIQAELHFDLSGFTFSANDILAAGRIDLKNPENNASLYLLDLLKKNNRTDFYGATLETIQCATYDSTMQLKMYAVPGATLLKNTIASSNDVQSGWHNALSEGKKFNTPLDKCLLIDFTDGNNSEKMAKAIYFALLNRDKTLVFLPHDSTHEKEEIFHCTSLTRQFERLQKKFDLGSPQRNTLNELVIFCQWYEGFLGKKPQANSREIHTKALNTATPKIWQRMFSKPQHPLTTIGVERLTDLFSPTSTAAVPRAA